MASKTDLTATDNMAAAKKPALTDLREHTDSIIAYLNDEVKDNLVAMSLDCFPSGYAFDDDGLAQFSTYNLFDKQTGSDTYAGGDITIAAVGAWTDVDATNAAIVFTPDLLAGDFRVTFQFNVESVTSNATNETDVRFRLTDSTTDSDFIAKVHLVTGVTTTTNTSPVSLSYVFDGLAAAAQTVKLQYYLTTQTATVTKVLADATFPICMKVEKV